MKLSREELDKIACWIDLLVPYCGDYREANAWTEEEMKKHERYAEKRRQMEEVEQQNIDAMLGSKEPARGPGPGGPMMRARLLKPGTFGASAQRGRAVAEVAQSCTLLYRGFAISCVRQLKCFGGGNQR